MLGLDYILLALLLVLALPMTCTSIYLLVLTCASRRTIEIGEPGDLFFDVVVPAHNETAGIANTISSLRKLEWATDRFRVVVVADNCTDDTALIASEAGAVVLERNDEANRGKGYALAHAFHWSRTQGLADAVVVVDADTEVSVNMLEAFAIRLNQGECAVQCHYGVLNAGASWRTRLMAIALGSIHKLRSRARERLDLSCGIRGNGWCVTHALLDKLPYRAFSLTEDVEFGVNLGLAGRRVAYCDTAHVNGEMVTTAAAARSQRQRWEGGRFELIRSKVPILLKAAFSDRNAICLDLAIDLLVLPLSYIVLGIAIVCLGASALLVLKPSSSSPAILLCIGLMDASCIAAYVFRGWILSGVGPEGFWDLVRVPGFVAWKLVTLVSSPKSRDWIRTKRENS